MARPRKDAARTLRFEVRVTVDEDAHISAGAEQLGVTKSEYVRRMAMEGQVIIRQESAYGMSVAFQAKRLGVLLNQIARVANTTGDLPEDLARVCGQVERILDKIERME